MAFPAYASELADQLQDDSSLKKDDDWLQCSSYVPPENIIQAPASKKKHKSRHKSEKESKPKETDEHRLYIVDSQPVPQVKCRAPTTPVSAPSKSHKSKKKKKKSKREGRYFSEEPLEIENDKIDQEEYLKRTKEFNVLLREHPNDVDSWRQYVEFQDRGEGTKRGIAAKKLSIVEKALEHNSSSEELLVSKLTLMEELHPYDKVVSEAKALASKHASAKVGWQWLITSTQFNLTRLTAPGLINHFADMLQDTTKRGGQPKFVLDVLLEVGLFLRHAGLWELLWTLIEQHLEICFSTVGSGMFKIAVPVPEDEINKVEDEIMTSGLPLHALWIRAEHLRSCVHFLPSSEEGGDHQRLILPEDVAPLVYPITLNFSSQLSAIALTLLKVPPLPCTEAFVTYLGLNSIQWHLESSEILLTPLGTPSVSSADFAYLRELEELLVPPQYIKDKLGSDLFMDAVDKMFDLIVENCSQEKIIFTVWKIRWWQFCVRAKSTNSANGRKFLSKAKTILKKERTSLPIYVEYALLEESLGNVDASIRVLETAINIQEPGLLASTREKRYIFALYRVYAEVLLRNEPVGYKQKLRKLMIAMSFGQKMDNVAVTPELALKALERFEHVSVEIVGEPEHEYSLSLEDIVLGSSDLHWLACHSWLNFVERGKLTDFLVDGVLEKGALLSEGLAMLKIDIMKGMAKSGEFPLDYKHYADFLVAAVTRYPNNTIMLHNLSSITCDGVKWGKISSSLIQSGSSIAVLFLVLFSKTRFFNTTNQSGAVTKMFSLLTKCTESKKLERCPLIWRLLLQYVSQTLDEDRGDKEFHKAIEKCPWVKILYYEAANQFPKYLADVQDLITEKELRLHVTPEELEILREPGPPEAPSATGSSEVKGVDGVTVNVAGGEGISEVSVLSDELSSGGESESTDSTSSEDSTDEVTECSETISTKQASIPTTANASSSNECDVCTTSIESSAEPPDPSSKEEGDEEKWSEEKLKRSRELWENKRKMKRGWQDIQNLTQKQELDSASALNPRRQNLMSLLEDEQVSTMVEDKCEDQEIQPYAETSWNKDKLNSLREHWESKRKK